MRIIGGNLKRKNLRSPPEGSITRPMPDRVRESLFNLLRGHFEGQNVADFFCGSGPIGIEAISRGAKTVAFVEKDRRVVRTLEANIADLEVGDRAQVIAGDALSPLTLSRLPEPLHVIFFDPPYPMVQDPETWPRVRDQFARLVQRLDPTGFAMIRTPWPFTHEINPAGGEESADAPKLVEIDLSDEEALDEIDAFEAEFAGAAPVKEPVDLAVEGAEGPETHVYRHSGVHLYMRATEGEPSGNEA